MRAAMLATAAMCGVVGVCWAQPASLLQASTRDTMLFVGGYARDAEIIVRCGMRNPSWAALVNAVADGQLKQLARRDPVGTAAIPTYGLIQVFVSEGDVEYQRYALLACQRMTTTRTADLLDTLIATNTRR